MWKTKQPTTRTSCLSLNRDEAFSLLELLVSITASVMLLSFATEQLLVMYSRYEKFEQHIEDSAMFAAITRTMEEDAHASYGAGFAYGNLVLNRDVGGQFTYYVNAKNEFIRYQSSGGVAVIASGVNKITEILNGNDVEVNVDLKDGSDMSLGLHVGVDIIA